MAKAFGLSSQSEMVLLLFENTFQMDMSKYFVFW